MTEILKVKKMMKAWKLPHETNLLLNTCLPTTLLDSGNISVTIYDCWLAALHPLWEVATSTLPVTRYDRLWVSCWGKCRPNQVKEGFILAGSLGQAPKRKDIGARPDGDMSTTVSNRHLVLQGTECLRSGSLHFCRQIPNGQGSMWCQWKFWQEPWRKRATGQWGGGCLCVDWSEEVSLESEAETCWWENAGHRKGDTGCPDQREAGGTETLRREGTWVY